MWKSVSVRLGEPSVTIRGTIMMPVSLAGYSDSPLVVSIFNLSVLSP